MQKIIQFLKTRVLKHWQTTIIGVLIYVGYRWFHSGKLDFQDFKEYLVLIPTIILLLMKDFKNGKQDS